MYVYNIRFILRYVQRHSKVFVNRVTLILTTVSCLFIFYHSDYSTWGVSHLNKKLTKSPFIVLLFVQRVSKRDTYLIF